MRNATFAWVDGTPELADLLSGRGIKPTPASKIAPTELDAEHTRIKELESEDKNLCKAIAAAEAVIPENITRPLSLG